MARPGSDKVRIKTVRNRSKNGTVYVYERKCVITLSKDMTISSKTGSWAKSPLRPEK